MLAVLFGISHAAVSGWRGAMKCSGEGCACLTRAPQIRLRAVEVLFPHIFPPRPELVGAGRAELNGIGIDPNCIGRYLREMRGRSLDRCDLKRIEILYPEAVPSDPETVGSGPAIGE